MLQAILRKSSPRTVKSIVMRIASLKNTKTNALSSVASPLPLEYAARVSLASSAVIRKDYRSKGHPVSF